MTRALAFLRTPRPGGDSYGERLMRLRWQRAAAADEIRGIDPAGPATQLQDAPEWVLVANQRAIPLGPVPSLAPGLLTAGRPILPGHGAFAHTLREVEAGLAGTPDGEPAAIAFWTADFAAGDLVTVENLYRQLLSDNRRGPDFPVLVLDEPSDRERPELTRRLPAGRLRILDVGCGAGGFAEAISRNPGWEVVGIERDPGLAELARRRCTSLIEGDLVRVLPELASAGQRFDAIVFADVLEHVDDPGAALAAARRLVESGGRLLVSVPNAGHLSVVRDLLLGRFDPVPSGLCDAGHLRWFTRASLQQAIEESGWILEAIDGEAGAPAPEPEAFLALAKQWPDADGESLGTYQWIATARAR